MGEISSRSHCFVRFHVRRRHTDGGSFTTDDTDGAGVPLSSTSTLCFVDMAGNEAPSRAPALIMSPHLRDLISFSRVIQALEKRQGCKPTTPHPYVPYRDASLTRLLQPFLSGINGARFALIATVSPHTSALDATRSTLRLARLATRL